MVQLLISFTLLGVGFISSGGRCLTSLPEVLAADEPIAVSIDGNAVREIPGPKGLPYLGNYTQIYPDHLGNHQRLFDTYGELFAVTSLGTKWHYTNDPNLCNIFSTESEFFSKKIIPGHPLHPFNLEPAGIFFGSTDSENWRVTHKFLPPALGPKAVKHYAPKMQLTVEDSFKVFDQLDEEGEAWNAFPYMMKLTSQTIMKLVLGVNVQHFTSPDARIDESVLGIVEMLELARKISTRGSWYSKLPFGDPQKLRNLTTRVRAMLNESIKNAKRGVEDLELQEAALEAENIVGAYMQFPIHLCKWFIMLC